MLIISVVTWILLFTSHSSSSGKRASLTYYDYCHTALCVLSCHFFYCYFTIYRWLVFLRLINRLHSVNVIIIIIFCSRITRPCHLISFEARYTCRSLFEHTELSIYVENMIVSFKWIRIISFLIRPKPQLYSMERNLLSIIINSNKIIWSHIIEARWTFPKTIHPSKRTKHWLASVTNTCRYQNIERACI